MSERPSYRKRLLAEYGQLAPQYEKRWSEYLKNSHQLARSLLPENLPGPKDNWLDVACGTGMWLAQLRDLLDGPLIGLDLNADMLRHAMAKNIANAKFLRAGAESLPLEDESVSGISCLNALHYFNNAEHTLDEFVRVLKPKSHLLIVDWCADYWFQAHVLPWVLRLSRHAHARTWRSAELQRALEARGLKVGLNTKLRFSPVWELMGVTAQKL
ncbi:MAG: class I SAM-dependent methyltransferase [Pseudomonadota bacterium]